MFPQIFNRAFGSKCTESIFYLFVRDVERTTVPGTDQKILTTRSSLIEISNVIENADFSTNRPTRPGRTGVTLSRRPTTSELITRQNYYANYRSLYLDLICSSFFLIVIISYQNASTQPNR